MDLGGGELGAADLQAGYPLEPLGRLRGLLRLAFRAFRRLRLAAAGLAAEGELPLVEGNLLILRLLFLRPLLLRLLLLRRLLLRLLRRFLGLRLLAAGLAAERKLALEPGD